VNNTTNKYGRLYLGTYNNGTQVDAITILHNGNVGIGTTDPGAKLDVQGSGRTGIRVGGPSTSSGAVGDFFLRTSNDNLVNTVRNWSLSFRTDTFGANTTGSLVLYADRDTGSGVFSDYIAAFKPTGEFLVDGNVGIGTTGPSAKLDVVGNLEMSGSGIIKMEGTKNTTHGIEWLYNSSNGDRYGLAQASGGNLALYTADSYAPSFISFNLAKTDDTFSELMRITHSGNVGIGTTSPGAKLDVAGTMLVNRESVAYYRSVIHKSGASSETGTLKITLPKSWSNTMMKVKIEGFNYVGGARGTSWSVIVGGYNYSGTPTWYNYFAEIHGASPFNKVRLAHDGAKNVILLGTTSSSWSYPKIAVTEFMAGHSSITGWDTGWSISWITDETGITNIVTPTIDVFRNTAGNVGIGTTNPGADLHVYEDDADIARIYATGNSQGTGMVYVGQSTTYGGGITYNGDGTPASVGSTDHISIFRRTGGVDTELLHWVHNNSTAYFEGNVDFQNHGIVDINWGASDDGSGSGLDADLLDGYDSSRILKYQSTYSSSTDWNTLADTSQEVRIDQINNGAAWPNSPGNYGYGGVASWRLPNHNFQLYASHTAANGDGLRYRTGWNNSWYGWKELWDSGNDGSGSGLDADKLDGISSGSFLRSDANDTFTATSLTLDSGAYLNTRLIGSLGTELGIAAGEMWSTMNANMSGEILWLGGEGGVKIVSSPDNMASGWAGRHEATLVNSSGNSSLPGNLSMTGDLTVSGGNLYIGNDAEWRDNGTNIIYTPDSLDVDGYSYFDGARMDANLNLNNHEIDNINYLDIRAAEGYGLRFWSNNYYKISMGNSANYKYGWVADYSIKTQMNNDGDRGFTWGVIDAAPTASLDTQGYMTLAGDLRVNGGNIYWGDDEQIYRNAEDVLRTPGKFIVDGSVGIGDTSPSEKLEVAGNINLTVGEVKYNGNRLPLRTAIHICGGWGTGNTSWSWNTGCGGWHFDSSKYSSTSWIYTVCFHGSTGDAVYTRLYDSNGNNLEEKGTTSTTINCQNSTETLVNGRRYMITGIRTGSNNYVSVMSAYFTQDLTPGSDLAEFFSTPEEANTQTGDILSANQYIEHIVSPTTSIYDKKIVGIAATKPGLIIGETSKSEGNTPTEVALVGRVPTKITSINGSISPGDPITSSSLPGIGMKATKAGPIVGKALESTEHWNENTCPIVSSINDINWPEDDGSNPAKPCFRVPIDSLEPEIQENIRNSKLEIRNSSYIYVGKLMVFVNVSWYDPDVYLTSAGDLQIVRNDQNSNDQNNLEFGAWSLELLGEQVRRIGAFAELVAAKIKAGLVETKILTAEDKIISPIVETNEIKLKAKSENGKTTTENSKLVIKNTKNEPIAEFSENGQTSLFGDLLVQGTVNVEGAVSSEQLAVTGDADIQGAVNSEQLAVSEDATISGTLYADNIVSKKGTFGELIADKISAVRTELEELVMRKRATDSGEITGSSAMAMAKNWETQVNDQFSNANDKLPDELVIASSLIIQGKMTAEEAFINQHLLVGNIAISGNAISTLADTLYLQPSGTGKVDILAGTMVIEDNGSVTINGNLLVQGAVNSEQLAVSGDATVSGSLFANLINAETINAETAQFNKVNIATGSAEPIIADSQTLDVASNSAQLKSNAAAGEGIIPAGKTEVVIYTDKLTPASLVYITPASKTKDYFVVAIKEALDKKIKFNWWIIN